MGFPFAGNAVRAGSIFESRLKASFLACWRARTPVGLVAVDIEAFDLFFNLLGELKLLSEALESTCFDFRVKMCRDFGFGRRRRSAELVRSGWKLIRSFLHIQVRTGAASRDLICVFSFISVPLARDH